MGKTESTPSSTSQGESELFDFGDSVDEVEDDVLCIWDIDEDFIPAILLMWEGRILEPELKRYRHDISLLEFIVDSLKTPQQLEWVENPLMLGLMVMNGTNEFYRERNAWLAKTLKT